MRAMAEVIEKDQLAIAETMTLRDGKSPSSRPATK